MFPASESLKTLKDIRAEKNSKMQLFEAVTLLGFLLTKIDQAFDPRSEEERDAGREPTLGTWVRAYKRIFGTNRVSFDDVRWAIRIRNMHAHPEKYDEDATKEDTLRAVEHLLRVIELDVIPQVAKTQPKLAQGALGYDPHRTWKWIAASLAAAVVVLYLILLIRRTSPTTKVEYVDIGPTPAEIRLAEEQAAEESRARALGKHRAMLDGGDALKRNIQAFETKLDELLTNEEGKRLASLDYAISAFQAIQARTRPTPADVDAVLERIPPKSLYQTPGEPLYRPPPDAVAKLDAIDQALVDIEQRLRPDQRELNRLLAAVSKRSPAELDLKATIEEHRKRAADQIDSEQQERIGDTLNVGAVWKGDLYGDGTHRTCMWFVHSHEGENIMFKSPSTATTLEGFLNGRKLSLTERGNGGVIATYRAQIGRGRLDGLWEPASGVTRGGNFSLRYTPPDTSEVDAEVLRQATKPPHPFQPDTKWLLTIDMGERTKPTTATITVNEKTGPNTFRAADTDGRHYGGSVNLSSKVVGLNTQDSRGYRSDFSGPFTDTEAKGTANLGTSDGRQKHAFVLKLDEPEVGKDVGNP